MKQNLSFRVELVAKRLELEIGESLAPAHVNKSIDAKQTAPAGIAAELDLLLRAKREGRREQRENG